MVSKGGLERPQRRSLRKSGVGPILACSRLLDAGIVAGCFLLFWSDLAGRSLPVLVICSTIVPVSMGLFDYFGVYESHRLHGVSAQIRQILSAQLTLSAIIALYGLFLVPGHGFARTLEMAGASTVLLVLEKIAARSFLTRLRRGGADHRKIAFVGSRESAEETAAELAANPGWGLRMAVARVGEPGNQEFLDFETGRSIASDIEETFRKSVVDEVWIGVPFEQLPAERATIEACDRYGLLCRLLVFSPAAGVLRAEISEHNGILSLGLGGLGHSDAGMAVKRLIDVVLSSVLLVGAAPLMLAAAALVKLSSPGPVLFSQWRAGLRGRRFRILKFRTMVDGAETMVGAIEQRNITRGPTFKDPADWRITPIGRILRRFSIDELPQLWNVLRGEMSIVGPRPLPLHEAERVAGVQRKRFSMRPGLTCLWQVNGRSEVEYAQWMHYDLQYIEAWSLWLDLRLILKTVPVVLSGRGAY